MFYQMCYTFYEISTQCCGYEIENVCIRFMDNWFFKKYGTGNT